MKGIIKKIIKNPAVTGFLFVLLFALGGSNAYAATTPSLGAAASYGLLSTTYVDPVTALQSTINGDVGFTIAPAQVPLGVQTNYGAGAPYATAGIDQGTALTALSAGANAACDFTFPAGAVDLATEATHVPLWGSVLGEYYPGVYCTAGGAAASIGTAGINLNGAGTYIFRIGGAFTTVDDSDVRLLGGASACDVFFAPAAATTIGAFTVGPFPNALKLFRGNIIDDSGITLGANSRMLGRALAFASAVTLGDRARIDAPTCAGAPSGGGSLMGTITVVKTVINDNDGNKTVADFPLYVDNTQVNSGETRIFFANSSNDSHQVIEPADHKYTRTFSGDCDKDGFLKLNPSDNMVCLVTNNDIGAPVAIPPVPPIIDVVKVPSPLALPKGPGKVDYTYTLTNVGTVPVTDITMVGDTCSPIVLASGDTNSNGKLEVTETWKYTCSWNLTETHTNTVVATGWANGISAVDIASATVVVGKPIVPPLIHVTKTPRPLTLPAGGGMVTYTKKVTNPGTVTLSNVRVTDDKCANVKFISGDVNRDSMLDPTEKWTYTCQTNLTSTTTNTVMATGDANGLRARDFAVATVVAATAVPKLPNTGVSPMESLLAWPVLAISLLAVSIIALVIWRKKVI